MLNNALYHLDKLLGYKLSSVCFNLRHKRASKQFHHYLKSKIDHCIITDMDPGLVGDKDIISKTSVLREHELPRLLNPNYYFYSGYSTMLSWLQKLDQYSFNLDAVNAIMEFGCGSARLIRLLRCIQGIRLVGTDLQSNFIEWCNQNIPNIEFYVNGIQPPISFLDDNSFDLIIAQSVFTHIPLELQTAWLEEMHRIIRPGGFLMANVVGRALSNTFLSSKDQSKLKKQGHLILDSNDPRSSYSTQMIGSWDVFQTEEEILKAFGSVFHLHAYIPGWLDLLILQKHPVSSQKKPIDDFHSGF